MTYFIIVISSFLIGIIPNYSICKSIYNSLGFEQDWKVRIFFVSFDIIKGMLVVFITKYFLNFEFFGIMLSLIISLISHSFFQGFKLRSRDGHFVLLAGLSIFLPIIVILWGLIWLITFIYKRNINFSLLTTSFLTGLVSITSSDIINNEYWYSDPTAASNSEFSILVGLLFTTLLITQIDNFKTYFSVNKGKVK